MTVSLSRARAQVNLSAIARNYRRLTACGVPVMGVVKADAYGHGAVEVARALRADGADWLGVALLSEAVQLRAAGDRGRMLAWLWAPGDPALPECLELDVDVSVSSEETLAEVVAAAVQSERRARVHIKVDTGLNRNGVARSEWTRVFQAAERAQQDGVIDIVGLWSHLASADDPSDASNAEQRQVFRDACDILASLGVEPPIRHLANSGATLNQPESLFDLARAGIAVYGVSPGEGLGSSAELGLVPAMTLVARLAHVKHIDPGARVSYGGTWVASEPTWIGLVPVGYGDGIPRAASSRAEVLIGGRRCRVLGVIAMDQMVVDLGPETDCRPGDDVIVFGAGDRGEPTAADWARWSDTIGYEIVTRISPRIPRQYVTLEAD